MYLDASRYKKAMEIPNLKIFHYCGSLNFASRNSFKNELLQLLDLNLIKEIKRLNKMMASSDYAEQKKYIGPAIKCLIIDFSALSYIDPSGVTSLKLLIKDFNTLGISVFVGGSSCKF
jgi:solute carrier family 26, other